MRELLLSILWASAILQSTAADQTFFLKSLVNQTTGPGCSGLCQGLGLYNLGGGGNPGTDIYTIDCTCRDSQAMAVSKSLACRGTPFIECCIDCPSQLSAWRQQLQQQQQASQQQVQQQMFAQLGSNCVDSTHTATPQRIALSAKSTQVCAVGARGACAGKNDGDACDAWTLETCFDAGGDGSDGGSGGAYRRLDEVCRSTGGTCKKDTDIIRWCSQCTPSDPNSNNCMFCNYGAMDCIGSESDQSKQKKLALGLGLGLGLGFCCCLSVGFGLWCVYRRRRNAAKQLALDQQGMDQQSYYRKAGEV